MKKKKILIILIIIAVLAVAGTVFGYLFVATDTFKSDKELFAKYMTQNTNMLKQITNLKSNEMYQNLENESKYEVNTVINTTYSEGGGEVQDLLSGDRVVYTAMADLTLRWGETMIGRHGYSEIGAVVGATFPQTMKLLREKYDGLFFLVPGYGAQGGTARNVQFAFDRFGHGAVVTASRSIICAWQQTGSDGTDYLDCARAAALKMKNDIGKFVSIL